MSRVIKFRAWDGIRKRMMTSPKFVEFRFNNKGRLDAVNYNPKGGLQNLELMQFTGLTDKNGVDIYESDILAFHVDWAEQPNKEVIFDDEFHSYVLLSGIEKEWVAKGSNHYKYWTTDEDNIYLLHQAESYDCEVIGNIYQHPELLK